jgi:hypothetical protein
MYSGFVALLPEHDLLHTVFVQTPSKQEELYEVTAAVVRPGTHYPHVT